eukprot:CAMPEP_0201495790 /NCGR_PEP_ID=MMETSP0151_2-20130828/56042_1 /ASSEMBLY_ACC=CAM_ASM_000257 /TAXON_ID=200890 /ORGANISM="Paramoeba atlantica, Strain 621/1 / CCAP 1560/9" /LENGTH=51 /DNA_ID=CAMNT_0047885087 /DNA_START=101 /DNA_END=253 /DNA_ORIENTATION=+
MERKGLKVEFESGLVVATSHLESRANKEMRIAQLQTIFSVLDPSSSSSSSS